VEIEFEARIVIVKRIESNGNDYLSGGRACKQQT
jgi:hypothetical protein